MLYIWGCTAAAANEAPACTKHTAERATECSTAPDTAATTGAGEASHAPLQSECPRTERVERATRVCRAQRCLHNTATDHAAFLLTRTAVHWCGATHVQAIAEDASCAVTHMQKPDKAVSIQACPCAQEAKEGLTINLAREAPPLTAMIPVSLEHLRHVGWCLLVMATTHHHGHDILHRYAGDEEHAHLLTPVVEGDVGRLFNGGWTCGGVGSQG